MARPVSRAQASSASGATAVVQGAAPSAQVRGIRIVKVTGATQFFINLDMVNLALVQRQEGDTETEMKIEIPVIAPISWPTGPSSITWATGLKAKEQLIRNRLAAVQPVPHKLQRAAKRHLDGVEYILGEYYYSA